MGIVSGGGGGKFNGGTITNAVVVASAGADTTLNDTGVLAETSNGSSTASLSAGNGAASLLLQRHVGVGGDMITVSTDAAAVLFRLDASGGPHIGRVVVPADADIDTSTVALWLDDTVGATKLMVKAKDSGGTVRAAAISLA